MFKNVIVNQNICEEDIIEWKLKVIENASRIELWARNPSSSWTRVLYTGSCSNQGRAYTCNVNGVNGLIRNAVGDWDVS